MLRTRALSAALVTALVLCLSACNPMELKRQFDTGRLMGTAQSKIYSLTSAGVTGFRCNVDVDWPGFFTSVNGEALPATSSTMQYLNAAHLSFSTDLASNTRVNWYLPPPDSVPMARRSNLTDLTDNVKKMLSGYLEAWVPTLNGHLLPLINTSLENTPDGYLVSNNVGEQKNKVTLDHDLHITHLETIEPTLHSELDSVFTWSPHGLLMTSLGGETRSPPDAAPIHIRMQTTYAEVSGVQLPETLFITVPGMGLHMKFVDCTVQK